MNGHYRKEGGGVSCRSQLEIMFLAADFGEGDVEADRQFVLDWLEARRGAVCDNED